MIHIIPQEHDLGIGGCWNKGICHEKCGKFAIQLDSDDLYKDESTLQKIVDTFYKESCAMVIGTYLMTDFQLNEIPPGIIDHKEWTPENGKNNALRINGLGAPRAFYTPILRDIKLPNTSYGEDYAIGLRISREYKIGRIYDVIYLCRRWEGNSDAALSTEKVNRNNFYKDRIRTWEIKGRIQMHTIDEEFQELVEEMIENQKENWELAKRNYEALEENPELANYIAKLILNQKLSPEKIVNVVKENPRFSKISLTKQTIYHSIITGKIPGVTKDSLRTEASTIFSNGQICIPKWVLEALKLKDGDVLDLNLKENGEIVYKKRGT